MSVLIKGMKMPTGCITCPCMSFGRDDCTMWCKWLDEPLGEWSNRGGKWRHPDCPMVEVPTPHGRLKDSDDLLAIFNADARSTSLAAGVVLEGVCKTIATAPTILEAEEAEPVKHGKWVELRPLKNIFVCSLCGQWGDYHWNYCPNCGAKMTESGE